MLNANLVSSFFGPTNIVGKFQGGKFMYFNPSTGGVLLLCPVYKITAGHRSISDHSVEMTAQIVVWSVLLSDYILICASTSCKLGCNSGPGSYGPESLTLNAITFYIASPSPKTMSEQN